MPRSTWTRTIHQDNGALWTSLPKTKTKITVLSKQQARASASAVRRNGPMTKGLLSLLGEDGLVC